MGDDADWDLEGLVDAYALGGSAKGFDPSLVSGHYAGKDQCDEALPANTDDCSYDCEYEDSDPDRPARFRRIEEDASWEASSLPMVWAASAQPDQPHGGMPVEAPGAGVGGIREGLVLVPGTWATPGGQLVVLPGGWEMGGFFIGSLGVGGVVGVVGAPMALTAAALSTSAERVADRDLMDMLL